MNPLAAEWVAKAEADYQGAIALQRRRKTPLPDLVCFHCQQSAEKYLKAFLQHSATVFPKTHVLVDLMGLVRTVDPTLGTLQAQLVILEDYAVKFRYPGMNSTPAQAKAALQALRTVRRELRSQLGLSPAPRTQKRRRRRS